jgi:hypothetical protein
MKSDLLNDFVESKDPAWRLEDDEYVEVLENLNDYPQVVLIAFLGVRAVANRAVLKQVVRPRAQTGWN